MKKLLYVRHGESQLNAAGLLSGRIETPLTERGIEQAKTAGAELSQRFPGIDTIVCSPYSRTYETAKLIAEKLGYSVEKIQTNDLLIERSFGVLEGTSGSIFLDSHSYKDIDKVENAETVKDLQARAEGAFTWLQGLEAETVLVVGHGAFARALTRVVRGLPYDHEYEVDTSIDNAAIVELI